MKRGEKRSGWWFGLVGKKSEVRGGF